MEQPNPNAPIRFGQLSRVTGYRMQPFYNEDANLMKSINFAEGVHLEIRADAFNLFNRHILAEPYNLGPNPGNPTTNFGFINGTTDSPRALQVELRLRF